MFYELDLALLHFFNGSQSAIFDQFILTLTNGLTWIPLYIALFVMVLKNNECIVDEKSYLLVPDKEARLPKPKFTVNVTKENGKAVVRITSDCYARYVFVDSDALASAWDDNYITILPGATAVFTADADDSVSIDSVASTLTIQNMADIETYLTAREERKLRRSIFWSGKNWLTYILCKLFM